MRIGMDRPKLNVFEKLIVMAAMIILTPIFYLVLGPWYLLVTFMDWIRSEWRKMDMTGEEIEEAKRRCLIMHAEHILGRKIEPVRISINDDKKVKT